jgi:hypothetical protein
MQCVCSTCGHPHRLIGDPAPRRLSSGAYLVVQSYDEYAAELVADPAKLRAEADALEREQREGAERAAIADRTERRIRQQLASARP